MRKRTFTHVFGLVLTGTLSILSVFPQDSSPLPDDSPLATVFYLLSKTEKDSNVEEKACLANSFAGVGKFEKLEGVAGLIEKDSYVDWSLIAVAEKLIAAGKHDEASRYASFLLKRSEGDVDSRNDLLRLLVRLNRGDEAVQLMARSEGDNLRINGYFKIIDAYLELGNREKAAGVVVRIAGRIEASADDRDRSKLALVYAKLGKPEPSLRHAERALKSVVWKAGILEYDHTRIVDDVFEAYLLLGEYQLANAMLVRQGKAEDPESLIQIGQSHLSQGNRKQADQLLERAQRLLDPKDYSDSFDLGRLTEIYLKQGEIIRARRLAEGLTGSEYMRQQQLMNIADIYIKKRSEKSALEVLNFALEQTKKIKTDEEESGLLSTSGLWDQARYQSHIVLRLINGGFDARALEVISQIKKPYLKASLLTEFAEARKQKRSATDLGEYLDEALSLLRTSQDHIFDSNKYDVYAKVARIFAEIGRVERANEVFGEVLSKDQEMYDRGLENYLLTSLCNIGVEFDRSHIAASPEIRSALRKIVETWESDGY